MGGGWGGSVFFFFGGGGGTGNSGNLPYLAANTYGLDFIKIRGILIFRVGGRSPLLEGLHVTCDAHFRTRTRDDVCKLVCGVS